MYNRKIYDKIDSIIYFDNRYMLAGENVCCRENKDNAISHLNNNFYRFFFLRVFTA